MDKYKLNQSILLGNFELAFQMIRHLSLSEILDILFIFMYDYPSILYYGFFSFLIKKNETAEYHYGASLILSNPLNIIKDAENLAFYHALKCIEIEPDSIDYHEYILIFNSIPMSNYPFKLLGDVEAIHISNNILKLDPDNKTALATIQKIQNSEKMIK